MSAGVAPVPTALPAGIRRARRRRAHVVVGASLVLLAVLVLVALLLGAAGLTPGEVVRAALGHGDAGDVLVVRRLRLPRVTGAVLAGGALGTAGALFQSTLRNHLASPDLLGVSGGASLGAVWALLVLGLGGLAVAGAAALGALAVAAAIWLLAWREGLHGIRFVLVGIGFAYLTASLVGWLLTRADVREAAQALLWTVGSVADVRDTELRVLAVAVALLVPLALREHGRQRVLALGDDHARALGVAADRGRVVALTIGVVLVAAATSVAGPIPFVALVTPAIARRLVDDGGPALAASAVLGATLVLAADVVGQHALPGTLTSPVGVVTGLLGAPYLLWLLARAGRGGVR